ncbi:MAG: T9SS type A sorting domain-containing protein [Bacteroidetes bacterium]|nr:T9SS type A sorting domain-containing protein [Bacteroidota bacterium]
MKMNTLVFRIALLALPLTSTAQAWKWAESLGTPNNATVIKNIRPYTGAQALVFGSFAAPSLTLGSHMVGNAGQDDGFIAIADDTGQYTWAAAFGGAGLDYAVDAAAGAGGELVVAGTFTSIALTIGSTTLPNNGETDAFLAKYNADHSLAWAHNIGTANIDEVSAVVMDAAGNAYVSGQEIDKFTLTTKHVFLRKYNASGTLVWEKKGTQQGGILQSTALCIDADQAVYLGGSLYGTVTFDNINLTSEWSYAAFIVKYNAAGAILDTLTNTNIDRFNSMQAHGDHIYACAERVNWAIGWGWPLSDSKIQVFQFNTDLQQIWEKSAGGESPSQSLDIARSMSVDNEGNAYVTGYFFSDTLHFAGQALPNLFNIHYYYPQIFVLKYAADGTELWGKSYGGIHTDVGMGIYAFGEDQFFLGGHFDSDPLAFGDYELHNTGTLDSMYVHLRPSRFLRKTMGFLSVFDKNVSSTLPEPSLQEVAVFPNPASTQITIRLKSPANSSVQLQIRTSDGRVVRQHEYGSTSLEMREDVSCLMPGIYFVTLQTAGGAASGKFVKW